MTRSGHCALLHKAAAKIAAAQDERVPYWVLQFTGDAVCQGKSGAW